MQSLSSLLASWEGERQLPSIICDKKVPGPLTAAAPEHLVVELQLGFW